LPLGGAKIKAGSLGYEVLPGSTWPEQGVDVLIPAALEHQITGDNVGRVHGRADGYEHEPL